MIMRKIFSIVKALALILLTTILGGLIAYFLFDVFEYRVPSGQWQSVNIGQEKAVQILGLDSNSNRVYVQTEQGKIYACDNTQCSLTTAPKVTRAAKEDRYTAPPPPGEVKDSFTGPSPVPGLCSGQTNYIILKDGSAWIWSKIGSCEIGSLAILVYLGVGLILGFFTGLVILVVRRRRQRRKVPAATI